MALIVGAMEAPMSKNQLFVEPRDDGRFSVSRADAQRASAVCDTQAQAIARARATLDKIASQKQPEFLPLNHQSREPGLEDFAQHYTMQAERDVHEGITRTLVEAVPMGMLSDLSECPSVEADELGDNVDFF